MGLDYVEALRELERMEFCLMKLARDALAALSEVKEDMQGDNAAHH